MLGNNLSILGVDAEQLDGKFQTVAAALRWMPTTGEYGERGGAFGDYEDHQELATRIGAHFTFSPEDAQQQPNADAPDNSQIRLSNGTIIFTPGALAPDVSINKVKYYMTSFDAGMKYRGFALEGEYFQRWLNDFHANGELPIDHMNDNGFQLMASAMALPKTVQLYTQGAYLFGEFGDPWEVDGRHQLVDLQAPRAAPESRVHLRPKLAGRIQRHSTAGRRHRLHLQRQSGTVLLEADSARNTPKRAGSRKKRRPVKVMLSSDVGIGQPVAAITRATRTAICRTPRSRGSSASSAGSCVPPATGHRPPREDRVQFFRLGAFLTT